MTPREVAHHIAMDALARAFKEETAFDLFCWASDIKSPSQRKQAKQWVAKLHNKLLEQSGLDGSTLNEAAS